MCEKELSMIDLIKSAKNSQCLGDIHFSQPLHNVFHLQFEKRTPPPYPIKTSKLPLNASPHPGQSLWHGVANGEEIITGQTKSSKYLIKPSMTEREGKQKRLEIAIEADTHLQVLLRKSVINKVLLFYSDTGNPLPQTYSVKFNSTVLQHQLEQLSTLYQTLKPLLMEITNQLSVPRKTFQKMLAASLSTVLKLQTLSIQQYWILRDSSQSLL